MPLANLPMTFAVHGATSSSAIWSPIAMCSMSALAPGFHCDVMTGRRVIASNVSALLKPAAHFDRLVGADAAGDPEGN